MTYIRSPVRLLVPISPILTASAIVANRGRLLVRPPWFRRVAYALCESPLRYACALPTFFLFGVNPNQLNQVDAPAYDLSKITAPVALFSARNDFFANPEDVSTLRQNLPNIVLDYIVPEPAFTHLDFVLGIDAACGGVPEAAEVSMIIFNPPPVMRNVARLGSWLRPKSVPVVREPAKD
ncbi:hypothetical protein HPB50_004397 [Hyalomma asiaticum]|uniref:Uncharacterized protein n=1 Tax=Hyalomma asiaticum TaxID=266040 RepID=A0ACB7RL53_HYAAI|nr:hypothetical protein HPB50_004397 [Hyalomma asiaticum]